MSLTSSIKHFTKFFVHKSDVEQFPTALDNLRKQNPVPSLRPEEEAIQNAIHRTLLRRHPEQLPLHTLPNASDQPINALNLRGAYFPDGISPGDIHNLSRCAPQPGGTYNFVTSVRFDTMPNKHAIARTAAGIVDYQVRAGRIPAAYASCLFDSLRRDLKQLTCEYAKRGWCKDLAVTGQYVLAPGRQSARDGLAPAAILKTAAITSPGLPTITATGPDLATNLQAFRNLDATITPDQRRLDPSAISRLIVAQLDASSPHRPPGPALPMKAVVDDFIAFARSHHGRDPGRRTAEQRPANTFEAYHAAPGHGVDGCPARLAEKVSQYWRPTSDTLTNCNRFCAVMEAYRMYEDELQARAAPRLPERVAPARPSGPALSDATSLGSFGSVSDDSTWTDHKRKDEHHYENIEAILAFNKSQNVAHRLDNEEVISTRF